MEEQRLVLEALPYALVKQTGSGNEEGLRALAAKVDLQLHTVMHEYGHHAVAKYLFEGKARLNTMHPARLGQIWGIGCTWSIVMHASATKGSLQAEE